MFHALTRRPLLTAGLALVGTLALLGVAAPWIAPHPPDVQHTDGLDDDGLPRPPSARFPFGTDSLGRDVFTRVLYGARVSLLVATCSVLAAGLIGVVVGLHAGYLGGWADALLMRVTDVFLAVPALLLAMAIVGLLGAGGRGLVSLLLVLAAVSWTAIARVVRGQVLSLRERPFIEAARALGYSTPRIVWRHLFPNVLPVVLVLCAMNTAGAIGLEAGLSYLGLGVPPPTPTWGGMIGDGQAYLTVAPWLVVPPGVAVVLAVLGFYLVGQGLQDEFDPFRQVRS
jgi:ABC-type dipeptide/oligopeptide/nickel transport system permease subunit